MIVHPDSESPRLYDVRASDREPLIDFMVAALERSGCRVIHRPPPNIAPFRITFETPSGERLGIMVYAFLANDTPTKNRPPDEHRFQVKYGSEFNSLHEIWHDPFGLYTTLFVGINPNLGFFVGADPVLHNPTRFSVSVEFKQRQVDEIFRTGWHAWERSRQVREEPVESLVGGTADNFLRFIRFERDAFGEDQGHRQLLAERAASEPLRVSFPNGLALAQSPARLHDLAREFDMAESEVLDLIANARRLKMAVRGWVAETHLVRFLSTVPGVSDCERSDEEGGPDVLLCFEGSRRLRVECKNVLRERTASGLVRVDFQRTRASKADPCSRYYSPKDFDVVAACLHAVSEKWDFQFAPTNSLDPHKTCTGKISNLVKLDERWEHPLEQVLRAVANA